MEKKQEEERIRTENILRGNPLLNKPGDPTAASDFKVKRRFVLYWVVKDDLSSDSVVKYDSVSAF